MLGWAIKQALSVCRTSEGAWALQLQHRKHQLRHFLATGSKATFNTSLASKPCPHRHPRCKAVPGQLALRLKPAALLASAGQQHVMQKKKEQALERCPCCSRSSPCPSDRAVPRGGGDLKQIHSTWLPARHLTSSHRRIALCSFQGYYKFSGVSLRPFPG